MDSRIENLKQEIVKCKLAFTSQKNRVMYELCDDSSDVASVQEAVEMMLDAQELVVKAMLELSKIYNETQDSAQLKTISEDMEQIYIESHQVQDTACKSVQSVCADKEVGILHHGLKTKGSHDTVNMTSNMQDEIERLRGMISVLERKLEYSSSINEESACFQNVGKDLWNQLEKVSIPVFSGDKGTYEGWRATFSACVDEAPVSAVYKLLQLKKYLSGEPLKLVERLGHSERAYETAKEKLNRKYGGKRRQSAMYLQQLKNFESLKDGDSKSFEAFADLLETAVFTLKENSRFEELGNGTLYTTLLEKLSDKQMVEFLRWSEEKEIEESVESLSKWSLRESEFHVISAETRHGLIGTVQKTYFAKQQKTSSQECQKTVVMCGVCKEEHFTKDCQVFLVMSCSERWDAARACGLCFRCLGSRHIGRECKQGTQCGIQGCCSSHHMLLHRYKDVSAQKENEKSVYSFRTVPVILKNEGVEIKVNALLDDASTKTYINADVAHRLGLTGYQETVNVHVLNGGMAKIESASVTVGLQSLDHHINRYIMAYTADSVTGDTQVIDWQHEAKRWPHLKDIHFDEVSERAGVDILIGLDHPDLHFSCCDIRGRRGEPTARKTPLGWTCVSAPVQGCHK